MHLGGSVPVITAANTAVRMVNSSVTECMASDFITGVLTADVGGVVWLDGTPVYDIQAVIPLVSQPDPNVSEDYEPTSGLVSDGVFYSSTPRTVLVNDTVDGWQPVITGAAPPVGLTFLSPEDPWFVRAVLVCIPRSRWSDLLNSKRRNAVSCHADIHRLNQSGCGGFHAAAVSLRLHPESRTQRMMCCVLCAVATKVRNHEHRGIVYRLTCMTFSLQGSYFLGQGFWASISGYPLMHVQPQPALAHISTSQQ